MSGFRASRSLIVALGLLIAAVGSAPLLVRWAHEFWNWPLIVLSMGVAVPLIGCVGWTVLQEQRGVERTSFAASALVVSGTLVAVCVVAWCTMGLVGGLLGFVLLPVASAALAVAWVQPSAPGGRLAAMMLGLPFPALVAWFGGRTDDFPLEGVIAGASILAVIGTLDRLRRSAADIGIPA